LGSRHCGFIQCAGCFWGDQTGPNPTDRRKPGSKHHIITDGNGIPLAVTVTGANQHDVTQLIPLVDAIPPVRGKCGRPRRRPNFIIADRAYDSNPHRDKLLERKMRSLIARRNTEHGSGLGILRWHVERTIAWLHKHRRLCVRYEKRADIHHAFLTLGCICVCVHFVENFC
jgi:transposase